jgi:hypothetical protein
MILKGRPEAGLQGRRIARAARGPAISPAKIDASGPGGNPLPIRVATAGNRCGYGKLPKSRPSLAHLTRIQVLAMPKQYWLVLPNGGRQWIDPDQFDLEAIAERARRIGGRIVVESLVTKAALETVQLQPRSFEPPISALSLLFRSRLNRIRHCKEDYTLDINTRATSRMLGGYYRRRKLVRVYSHDRHLGRRPLEELFDTFLHEIAHHLEYTEPASFQADRCQRVPGTMHSPLFWHILGNLKVRWARLQAESD